MRGDHTIGRFTFEPGWKWSECIKPIAKTDLCQIHHVGVAVAGKLSVTVGTETAEVSAGGVYDIPPGHDAEVVGDEVFVAYEFSDSVAQYAKPAS